eukprot:1146041-Pelagomonas_calceolata.AAC.16
MGAFIAMRQVAMSPPSITHSTSLLPLAAAFGWSVEHAPEGGLPAPVEGDMFGQPTPAEQEVLGRSGPLADHTWEEQQHQTNLRWLAETRTLQRRGPPCEDARQAERSSTFVNQVRLGCPQR